jgi:DNA-binding transcriptional ArsR family regulator
MSNDDPGAAPHDDDGLSAADHTTVREELERLRRLARGLTPADLRSGVWLARLVSASLGSYVRETDAGYFDVRYPDLTTDEIIRARIQQASRYASLEGALSAGAYTGAVAATIGSAGGASPLTLPAAAASFVTDLLFLSHLQLRLAHDVAVLRGVPLDLADPEDLWKLVRVAFAIRAGVAGRGAVGKGVPALVRPVLVKIFSGGAAGTRSLSVVGRLLLQRNLVKFSVPAVGVPLSMAVNRWSVTVAGRHADEVFSLEGRIADAARRMTERTSHHSELLWVLWLVIKSDALVHENERLLLKQVTALVGDVDTELAAISTLRSTLDVTEQQVWARLSAATEDLEALYEAGVVAAAVDGRVNVNELTTLRKLAGCCGVPYAEQQVRRTALGYS